MLKHFCFTFAVVLTSVTVASAQVSFERKFAEGTKFTVQKEEKTKQALVLNGMNIDTASSTFSLVTTTIGKRTADGRLELESKVDSMQSETSLPGGLTLQFDSSVPDKKVNNPLLERIADTLKAIVRLPVKVELNSSNHVEDAKLPEGEFEKLPAGTQDHLKSEWLKKKAEQSMAVLPDKPVKKGETWEVASELNAGDGNVLSFRTQYEYVGTVDQDGKTLDKITSKTIDVSYSITGNATVQLKNSDLKVVESSGMLLFDRDVGDITLQESKLQVAGPLTFFIDGKEYAGTVDFVIETKSTYRK